MSLTSAGQLRMVAATDCGSIMTLSHLSATQYSVTVFTMAKEMLESQVVMTCCTNKTMDVF